MSQPASIQAISLGHALDERIAGGGVVHSLFDRAVNLTMRGNLWTLLAEDRADLPFGIRLALSNLSPLGLRAGDPVSLRAGFVSIGSRVVIDCRAAPRWTPCRAGKLEPSWERRLAVVARVAGGRSWFASAAMAQAVRSAVCDATALGSVLAKVVGRGPGATPSGDDVLVGILAVLSAPHSSAEGAKAARSLRRALVPLLATTTDVSGHLLRQAVDGLFGRDVHELVVALIEGPPQRLTEKVRRVISSGATSGADMCEGLLVFAPDYFASGNERVSA